MKDEKIGRHVNIVSIGVSRENGTLSNLLSLIDKESNEETDLAIVPELCLGFSIHHMDGEAITKMRELAKQKEIYIAFTAFRYGDTEADVYNSTILIDRKGDITGVYDKAFPFWSDEHLDPPSIPGKDVQVFETDFGKIGITICFDVNFPDAFKRLSDLGAELVIWPSGYSGGISLQAHAINHNYYIVTCTTTPDCAVYDITGREWYYQMTPGVNVSKLSLDLDRCIFHFDLNMEKRDQLLAEHADDVEMDCCLEKEGWFTLRAKKPGVSVRGLAAEYGLEELAHYKKRKSDELDGLRGFSLRSL